MQWLFISASPKCSVTLTSHIKVSWGFALSASFACLFQSFNSAVIQLSWNNTWITAVGNHAKILLSTRLRNCLFPLQMHWHLGHIFWLIPVPYNVTYKQMRKNNTECTEKKKEIKKLVFLVFQMCSKISFRFLWLNQSEGLPSRQDDYRKSVQQSWLPLSWSFKVYYFLPVKLELQKARPEGRGRWPPWVLLLDIENNRDQKPFSSFLKAFTVRDERNIKQTLTDKATVPAVYWLTD